MEIDKLTLSTGSTPRLCAGGPSIMILIQSICIAFKGFSNSNNVEIAINDNAATLLKLSTIN